MSIWHKTTVNYVTELESDMEYTAEFTYDPDDKDRVALNLCACGLDNDADAVRHLNFMIDVEDLAGVVSTLLSCKNSQ